MKILTPVDQSARDGIVLPYCVRMADALEAVVALVHIIPLTRSLVPNAMRQAEAYLFAVESGLREQGLTTEAIVRRGDPAGVIVALASELEVDLIVMTTRARSSLGKFVLGSVADAVLANCPKPVLLLSEATNGSRSDEGTRRQSAYLATVIWHKQARGLYARDESKQELERLAASGLDRSVLFATYQALEDRGALFDWLDIDFQMNTLRKFLPEDIHALGGEELLNLPSEPRAA